MSQKPEYVKLTRRSRGLASYRSLWQGRDHILLVSSNGYTERYQRFQYTDIRSFLVLPSERHVYWTWIWSVCTAIFGIFVAAYMYRGDTPYISGPLSLLCLIGVIWNYAIGPSCELYLVTRVQTLRLPLHRRGRAENFLDRVQPEIATAQSEFLAASETPSSVEPPPLF